MVFTSKGMVRREESLVVWRYVEVRWRWSARVVGSMVEGDGERRR